MQVEGRVLFVRSCLFLSLSVATTSAYANGRPLTEPALNHLVSGAVMYINTPLNTKVPVRYGEDGRLTGSAGAVAFYLGAAKDSGKWWVERGRLCHKWQRWFSGKTQCLKVRKLGNKVFWTSDAGRTGTAIVRRTKPRAIPAKQTKLAAAEQAQTRTDVSNSSQDQARQPVQTRDTPSLKIAKVAAPKSPVTVERARPAPTAKATGGAKKQTSGGSSAKPQSQALRSEKQRDTEPQKKANSRRVAANTRSVIRQTSWRRQVSFRVAHVADTDVLNMRNGPSEYHPIVGQIPSSGRGVRIVGACQSWWCPVTHRNAKGWVNRYYLSAEYRSLAGRFAE